MHTRVANRGKQWANFTFHILAPIWSISPLAKAADLVVYYDAIKLSSLPSENVGFRLIRQFERKYNQNEEY